jgi:hypothetical protein
MYYFPLTNFHAIELCIMKIHANLASMSKRLNTHQIKCSSLWTVHCSGFPRCCSGEKPGLAFISIMAICVITDLLVVVLQASYSASLVSYLTARRPKLPFNSFSEFLQDGSFGLGVHRFSSLPSFFEVVTNFHIYIYIYIFIYIYMNKHKLFLVGKKFSCY